jgi:hypothetical protein
VDVFDMGLGCGGTRSDLLYLPIIITAQSASGVRLSWEENSNYRDYVIWRDTVPNFSPAGTSHATVVAPPDHFDDAETLGDPAVNYYYLVEGNLTAGGSLPSRHLGEFDFPLVAGEATARRYR